MKKDPLKALQEAFMRSADALLPGSSRQSPVRPMPSRVPIVPQTSWSIAPVLDGRALQKLFVFESLEERNKFVLDAIELEAEHKHCAHMTLDGVEVHVRLYTKNVGQPTELDKELASYLDEVYRDVTFERDIAL